MIVAGLPAYHHIINIAEITRSQQRNAQDRCSVAQIRLSEGISPEHLVDIYTDKFISRIAHDLRPHYPVFSEHAVYVSAFVDGKFVGAYLAIESTQIELEVHSLLKKTATPYSRELGRAFLLWCFSKPYIRRLTGYILEGFESARNHCLKMGFTLEGVKRNAFLISGKPRNVYIMGILREELEAQTWAE